MKTIGAVVLLAAVLRALLLVVQPCVAVRARVDACK
jgi:hypothetical protein